MRIGIYPQDGGLCAGGPPDNPPGLKNVQDGPQYGDEMVQRQLDGHNRSRGGNQSVLSSANTSVAAGFDPRMSGLGSQVRRLQTQVRRDRMEAGLNSSVLSTSAPNNNDTNTSQQHHVLSSTLTRDAPPSTPDR